MRKRLGRFRTYLEVSSALEIARRLLVMNAFDGILTIIGVVVGAHFSGVTDPKVVITTGVGGSIAMDISGASGAYLVERAERRRDLKKLEAAMLRNLEDSQYARVSKAAAVAIALVDGLSPAAADFFVVVPYFLLPILGLIVDTAFYASLLVGLAVLFILGTFLARVSDERPIFSGIQMILVGIVTIIIVGLLFR
jgi:predicted membrane protein (TIGR00267 family)